MEKIAIYIITLLFDIVFIEKILRTQPNVGKLYCLMRPAADDKAANQRLDSEVNYIYIYIDRELHCEIIYALFSDDVSVSFIC